MPQGFRSGSRLFPVLVSAALFAGSATVQAQIGLPDGFPAPCGLECFPKAFEAAKACREGGGDFSECTKAFADTLAACRTEAGCETPVLPPICGEACFTAARDAAKACHEAGGDVRACLGKVKTQLRTCLEEAGCDLPAPPDGLPRCGVGCLKEAFGVARDCLKGGGTFRDCVGSFREALEACREAEGCSESGEPPADQEGDGQALALVLDGIFTRGDANGDLEVDISDSIMVLRYLFQGTTSAPCLDAADASDDGIVDIADPILILSNLFQTGVPLPAPFPDPGFDPTDDAQICQ